MKIKTNWFRYAVQIFFFALIGVFAINHVMGEAGNVPFPFLPNASLHSLCPFGGVESILSMVTAGTLVAKLHGSTLVLSIIILVITLLFGAVFCAFICPLGTIQEWFGKLGKKIFKKRYNTFIPNKLHNILKYFRYVVLILTIILTYNAMKLVFLEVDPYYALYHFFTDEVTIGALIVLGFTLLGSLFIERPWCKYACPYGALLGLIGIFSVFKIRNNSNCNSCNLCNKKCPMNINISDKKVVNDDLCIKCLNCVDDKACPQNSLNYIAGKIKGEDR